jgi:hypothetical protein
VDGKEPLLIPPPRPFIFFFRGAGSVRVAPDTDVIIDSARNMMVIKHKSYNPQPLRRVMLPAVEVSYLQSGDIRRMSLRIETLQLDDMSVDTPLPVILSAKPWSELHRTRFAMQPFCRFSKTYQVQTRPAVEGEPSVEMLQRTALIIQEFNFSLTERLLTRFIAFAGAAKKPVQTSFSGTGATAVARNMAYLRQEWFSSKEQLALGAARASWASFHLHPLSIDLSFMLSPVRTDDADAGNNDEPNFVREILRTVGVTVGNLSHVPLRLNALLLEDLFCTATELQGMVRSHYTSSGLRQIYALFGSLDILGSPVQLVGHLRQGISDLFYEPLQADDKLAALGMGAKSLLAHTAAGAAGTVSGLTNTCVSPGFFF